MLTQYINVISWNFVDINMNAMQVNRTKWVYIFNLCCVLHGNHFWIHQTNIAWLFLVNTYQAPLQQFCKCMNNYRNFLHDFWPDARVHRSCNAKKSDINHQKMDTKTKEYVLVPNILMAALLLNQILFFNKTKNFTACYPVLLWM